jgi:hypothetical protein
MKHFKRFCAASVLTLMLALSTFAGEIDTMRVPPPLSQATSADQIEIGRAGDTQTSLTVEIALNLLQGVLSLI